MHPYYKVDKENIKQTLIKMIKKLPIILLGLFGLFTLGLNAQENCENNFVTVATSTSIFANEISWNLFDSEGNLLLASDPELESNSFYVNDICLDDGCYFLEANDTFGDGWNGANVTVYIADEIVSSIELASGSYAVYPVSINGGPDCVGDYGCTDEGACNYNDEASINDGSCTYPGCTDQAAINYNFSAGCEDNSLCEYPLECGEGEVLGQLYVCVFSQGENVQLEIANSAGDIVWEQNGFNNGLIFYYDICLAEGECYTATMSNADGTGWYNGYFWINIGVNDAMNPLAQYQIVNESLDDDLSIETVEFSVDGTCGPILGCTSDFACNFDPEADADNGSCTYPGCMDETATNYNPSAGCGDQDLCQYPVECEEGQSLVELYVCVFSEGQNVNMQIADDAGNIIYEQNGYADLAIEFIDLCLDPETCYTVTMSNSDGTGWYNGYYWVNLNGQQISTNSLDDDLSLETTIFSVDGTCGEIYGCMDPAADNYDEDATQDDGSCFYPQVFGCMNPEACNFDELATLDDGSCADPSCGDEEAINYDANAVCPDNELCFYVTDCENNLLTIETTSGLWANEMSWTLLDENSDIIAVGTEFDNNLTYFHYHCLNDGCYTLNMFDSFGDGWNGGSLNVMVNGDTILENVSVEDEFYSVNIGINAECEDPAIFGCTDPAALNYDQEATIDDGSCEYQEEILGCTDPIATNFNAEATLDDGSCVYDIDCFTNEVYIEVQTDSWPGEMSVDIIDENGDVVYTFIGSIPNAVHTETICLADGCFEVQLGDTFGDGWLLGSEGYLFISVNDEYFGGTIEDGTENSFVMGINSDDCEEIVISGCMDPLANNYNPLATADDGSCDYSPQDCEALFGIFEIDEEEAVVVVINLSTGDDLTYFWDFGDGHTSEDGFPIHFYEENGVYDVCLTISSADGCSSTYCATVQYDGANYIIDGVVVGTNGTDEEGFSLNVYSQTWLSIDEANLSEELSLFPIPAKEELNIAFNSELNSEVQITVMDLSGRLVHDEQIYFSGSQNRLDISELSNGMYVLTINSGNELITRRFEIQK